MKLKGPLVSEYGARHDSVVANRQEVSKLGLMVAEVAEAVSSDLVVLPHRQDECCRGILR